MTVFSFGHKARYLHYDILLTIIWGILASNPYSKFITIARSFLLEGAI